MKHPFPLLVLSVSVVLVVPCLVLAAKIQKIKARDNPAEYAAFSRPLSKDQRYGQALNRLSFGPRSQDLSTIKHLGLNKWMEQQLHPEKAQENRVLEQRLAPLVSLRLTIHDAFANYPSRQMIAAVARGKSPLPEDPELRIVVARLAERYLQRKPKAENANGEKAASQTALLGQAAQTPDDDSDLDPKVKIADLLNASQIAILKSGKPDQKRELLETIPASEWFDLAWALRPSERRLLLALAPAGLRRELLLTMNPESVVASDLNEGKLLRAVYSNHQLQELLVDFWYNHFNVFLNKSADRFTVPTYEREAIRPHVFGKFYDLLLATASSPAMLVYLDNWQSVGPPDPAKPAKGQSATPAKKKTERGLNENYGRELLELHTLGVDGGYTQQDVIDVARCFTGWTVAPPIKGGDFQYNDKVHDHGEKLVLGHRIDADGGMSDGLKVLEILAHHPATAHFISLRLAQRFVADNPPPSLVNRMAQKFLESDGDLRQVVETMLFSGEFWSQGAYQTKIKSPFEMMVSALRASDANVTSAFQLSNELQKLGEPLYRKLEPTGYSSANAEWINSSALLDRMNFSLALAENRILGVKVDESVWEKLASKDPLLIARQILAREPGTQTKAALEKAVSNTKPPTRVVGVVAGLTLGSPEFQRR